MKIIAVANQKGGVGKTTTAVTLAHGLALQGKRVLLLDLDPQGHVAVTLGCEPAPGLHRLVAQGESLFKVVVKARENLDIVPGDHTTERTKRDLVNMDFRERVLRDVLEPGQERYDCVLLDCAPSSDILHVSALMVADWLLTPTRLDALAVHGVSQLVNTLRSIHNRAGHGAKFAGVLPTFFDRRTKETHSQLQQVVEAFKQFVWPMIPQDARAREAPGYGQTLWEYSPQSPALLGYKFEDEKTTVGGYSAVLNRLDNLLWN